MEITVKLLKAWLVTHGQLPDQTGYHGKKKEKKNPIIILTYPQDYEQSI